MQVEFWKAKNFIPLFSIYVYNLRLNDNLNGFSEVINTRIRLFERYDVEVSFLARYLTAERF